MFIQVQGVIQPNFHSQLSILVFELCSPSQYFLVTYFSFLPSVADNQRNMRSNCDGSTRGKTTPTKKGNTSYFIIDITLIIKVIVAKKLYPSFLK